VPALSLCRSGRSRARRYLPLRRARDAGRLCPDRGGHHPAPDDRRHGGRAGHVRRLRPCPARDPRPDARPPAAADQSAPLRRRDAGAARGRRHPDRGRADRRPAADRPGPAGGRADRLRRARGHPRPDRRALACDAGRGQPDRGADAGYRLRPPDGRARGGRHADARLYHRARCRRSRLRAETGDRPRCGGRTAHLPLGRDDLADRRAWRFPPAERVATLSRHARELHRTAGRCADRRRRRHGPARRARTADEGGEPAQDHGGRRGRLALRSAGRHAIHRTRDARRSRGGRGLGHLMSAPMSTPRPASGGPSPRA